MQSGYIEALQIQREKAIPFETVSSVELVAGKGIVGDYHYGGGEKQITFISSKVKQWIAQQKFQGLCFPRFQGNFVTSGVDYSFLKEGDLLKTEHVIIEITSCSKQCFEECFRLQNNLSCELKTSICFGKVVKTGFIHSGDGIWCVSGSVSH